MKNDKFIFGAIFLFVVGVFFIRGIVFLDPDFLWHLKFGEIVATSGIPRTDPFSYTMPSFLYVNHEWFLDVLLYFAYPIVGQVGLVLFYLALVVGVYLVGVYGRMEIGWKEYSVLFLLFMAPVSAYFGVRPQIASWFLFAAFLRLIFDQVSWKKWRLFTPLLFFVWANMHGGFLSGLVAMFIVVVVRSVVAKRILVVDFVLLLICTLATLGTPYRELLWREVWSSIADSSLRYRVSEWRPFVFAADVSIAGLVGLSGGFAWAYRRKMALEKITVYIFFLIQAFLSNRNIPLWAISAIPVTIEGFEIFKRQIGNGKETRERYLIAFNAVLYMAIFIFAMRAYLSLKDAVALREDVFYPVGAVQYLKQTEREGRMFANYGWGGYLIWKMPTEKVFIDGRMPSWENPSAPANETTSVMDDYFAILRGDLEFEEQFGKYGITTVLWNPEPARDSVSRFELLLLRLVFGEEAAKPGIDLGKELLESGWVVRYQDKNSVVFGKET